MDVFRELIDSDWCAIVWGGSKGSLLDCSLLEIQCHWSPQECAEVSTLFEKFILHDSLPPKTMIEKSIQQSVHLHSQSWTMVREHLHFNHLIKSTYEPWQLPELTKQLLDLMQSTSSTFFVFVIALKGHPNVDSVCSVLILMFYFQNRWHRCHNCILFHFCIQYTWLWNNLNINWAYLCTAR